MLTRDTNIFDQLHPKLRQVLEKYGYSSPTPIQKKAIPKILEGKNVIISAPTGSGKTEAALLPVFSKMLEHDDKTDHPQLVYITPMRALNRDIYVRMRQISDELGLNSIVRHGDSSKRERRSFIEGSYRWFITTPESFSMIITHPASRNLLADIRWVIVDEVHEMIESERGTMLAVALERLRRKARGFQFIALSATIPTVDLVRKLFNCPNCIDVRETERKAMEIGVYSIPFKEGTSSDEDRIRKIIEGMAKLIESSKNAIIFTNTRDTAEFLAYKFRENGYTGIEVHHGSLSIEARTEAEKKLKNGSLKAVIATSSLELGIDIGTVDLVIQYNSPRQVLRLSQRIGRSGHSLGKTSRGIIFSPHDIGDMLESVVIARRALLGIYEDISIPMVPMDVALHQAVGVVLGGEAKRKEEIYEIIRKVYPFKSMENEKMEKILEFASSMKLLFTRDNGEVVPGQRAREYYYSTTMIPDTRKVAVFSVNGERIGTLDAEFVFSKLEEETAFILKGREWKVVSIDDDRVVVEEVEEHRGLPPSWMGDLIPVSREVSREAVALLRRICLGEGFAQLSKEYSSLTETIYENVRVVCEEQRKNGFALPHHEHILIESNDDESLLVIHVPLGSRGNFTLAMLLSRYLASRTGKRISVQSDAYKLFIDASAGIRLVDIEESIYGLASLSAEELREMLSTAVKASNAFTYRLIQVARKMGALSEDYSLKDSKKVLRYYKDTLIGEEALSELIFEKTDLNSVMKMLNGLRERKIKVFKQEKKGLSPIALYTVRGEHPISYSMDALPQELAISVLEKRVMEKEVLLKCLSCGYEKKSKIKDLPDIIRCERCGSRAVAPLPLSNSAFLQAVRAGISGKRLAGKDKEYYEDAVKRANLVISHGKNAVIALTPYGIGPRAASKALSKLKLGWKEFLRTLYEEERNYMKNRKYWD